MFDKDKTYIVYDGDCPFCSRYVELLRLREAAGAVELVNARHPHPAAHHAEAQGVTLDREMALIISGEVFSGPDCINRLALMSTPSTLFNRINARVFSSPRVSAMLYPAMRLMRNLTLRLLARPRLPASD
jgi:predicted DCC family thiol-disulfide oxidoreductase YuxK